MNRLQKRELAIGIVFLVIGIGYFYMTSTLPRKQFIDASFVPYILAITIILLGVLQIREASKQSSRESTDAVDKADYRTVLKTLALIIVYVALLEVVGFPIMTMVYLFTQFIVLKPVDQKANFTMYAAIAIVTSVTVYATFRYAFDMMLPVGLLSGLID